MKLNSIVETFQNNLIEAQSHIFALQQDKTTLLEENNKLKQQAMEFEEWANTKLDYTLTEIAPGTFVYVYTSSVDTSEPAHWLCPTCYQNRIKSILQIETPAIKHSIFTCHCCDSKFRSNKSLKENFYSSVNT